MMTLMREVISIGLSRRAYSLLLMGHSAEWAQDLTGYTETVLWQMAHGTLIFIITGQIILHCGLSATLLINPSTIILERDIDS